MNKKILIIGAVGAAAIAAYFILTRKNNTTDSTENAQRSALRSIANGYEDNVDAVTDDQLAPEQAEYNAARQEYYNIYNTYPRSTWTLEQIKQSIQDGKQIAKLVSEYKLITDDQQEVSTDGKTALELQQLIENSKNANRKKAWDERKKVIENYVEGFKRDIQDIKRFSWLNKEYNVGVMQNMLNLTQNEKIYANEYFANTGGCTSYSTNLGSNGPFKATTIAAAIPVGTEGWKCRKNNDIAKQVHEAYKNLTGHVNMYGEII